MDGHVCRDKFSDHLFWDVIREEVDMEIHAAFVVQRVLEYGAMNDWILLCSYYGIDRILALCKTLRTLDPVCLSFISAITHTPKEKFRCYHTRPLNPTLWNS